MHRTLLIARPNNTEENQQRLINIIITLLALLLLFTLISCDSNTREKRTTTDRDTMNSSIAPNSVVDSSTLKKHTLEVNLTDNAIGMPTQATSGPTVFRV